MKKHVAVLFSILSLAFASAPVLAQSDAGIEDAGQSVCVDDAFESNDTAQTATPMTPGHYDNLTGCDADEFDWYAINVPTGKALSVEINFIDDDADLDLYIYDYANGATVTELHYSSGTRNSERVWYDEFSADTDVRIRVKNFNADDGH